ncbi:MAG: response regulator transcription factor [Acidimicrobiales bacterium]
MAHLLVVDDDPDIRLLLRLELSVEGHQISEAGDGAAALAAIEAAPPDLVLLDIMMPVLDGRGVLQALDLAEAPPVVVITAMSSDDDRHVVELLELGALDVIPKPFDPGWLIRLVDAVLLVDVDEREQYRQGRLARARRS